MEREALAQVTAEEDFLRQRVLVIGGEGWSPGVIGIVAGRLTSRFHRPAAVLAVEGDVARGSARSIPGFHILEALRACGDCLVEFGGHAHAAGFTVKRERLGELQQRLNEYALRLPEELWQPALRVDAEVALSHLNRGVVTELERLEPLGEENPDPVLVSHGVAVAGEVRRLGPRGKHLNFYARQGNCSVRVIGFNLGERAGELAKMRGSCSLAYTPRVNAYAGAEPTVELELLDFRPRATRQGHGPEGSQGAEGGW
jgi:single-stranded-DNA-specific exonuclease